MKNKKIKTTLSAFLLGAVLFLSTNRLQAQTFEPVLVTDINEGSESSDPSSMTVFNDKLYFAADDGINGAELWSYDKTNGAVLIADIRAGSNSSNPNWLLVFKDKLYFAANDGINGIVLWSYDSTNGAVLAKDITNPSSITVFNDKLVFGAYNSNKRNELMIYDPTDGSVLDGFNVSHPANFTVFQDKIYFRDGASGELWSYDTANGAVLVADINDGSSGSYPRFLTVFNDKLYFAANDGINGDELWSYDTTIGAVLVADINEGSDRSRPEYLTVFQDKLYFAADDGINGIELWSYDTTIGAVLVADINEGSDRSRPQYLTVLQDKLYFAADDGITRAGLWSYDTTNGPALVNKGFDWSRTELTVFQDKLYFAADELWSLASSSANLTFTNAVSEIPVIHAFAKGSGSIHDLDISESYVILYASKYNLRIVRKSDYASVFEADTQLPRESDGVMTVALPKTLFSSNFSVNDELLAIPNIGNKWDISQAVSVPTFSELSFDSSKTTKAEQWKAVE